MEPHPILVIATAPDRITAQAISRTLVGEELAACCSVVDNVESTYRWNGEVTTDSEVVMIIKSANDRLSALTERYYSLHPYDVPELLVVEVAGGLPDYLAWVVQSTRGGARG